MSEVPDMFFWVIFGVLPFCVLVGIFLFGGSTPPNS